MRLSAWKLLIFAGKFLAALVPLALLWPWIGWIYVQLLASFVRSWMPDATVTVRSSTSLFIHVSPLGMTVSLDAMVFNMLLLTALMLATPGLEMRRRLSRLGLGVLLQMAFHVLDIVMSFRANYAVALTGSYTLRFLSEFLGGIGEQLSAVVIWLLLTWRSWLPMLQPTRHPTKEARP